MWNYVVTAQKPTAVTHSIVANFSGPNDINLIIAKCTRLEIYLLTPQGLQPLLDVPIYGRISTLELLRPSGVDRDWLFITTERYNSCLLSYNAETQELVTEASGSVSDSIGRPADHGQIGIVEPRMRLILLHLYDGLLKLILVLEGGKLEEAFNVRLDELQVYDIQFLHGYPEPTIAVLYQDNKDSKHLKTYTVNLEDKEMDDGPWAHPNLDAGSGMLIPVPEPFKGVLVVGDHTITYHSGLEFHTVQLRMSLVRTYEVLDSRRFLLGDQLGNLSLVTLLGEGTKVLSVTVDRLGVTTAPSTISYLDNFIIFVGSSYGDSQLVRLIPESTSPVHLEVLDSFLNLGPIVDFCFVDSQGSGQSLGVGQGQMVTCSGAFKEGSLRVVRSGIGIDEQASVELPGIMGLWSLRARSNAPHDSFLVVSFVGETRVLGITEGDELEEVEGAGFSAEEQTIFCTNVQGDQILQATRASIRLISAASLELLHTWTPPAGVPITVATANETQVLVATGGGTVVYLQVAPSSLKEVTHRTLEHEVACLDLTPLNPGASTTHIAAAGMWTDLTVRVLSLPGLEEWVSEPLGGEVIPRSVLFCTFDKVAYLLVGMGDGHLVTMALDLSSGQLTEKKKLSLGSQPLSLRAFCSGASTHVFAASDRPMVVHSSSRKLLFSNVNMRQVSHVCQFNSQAFPDSLALAVDGQLSIGTIDEIQKLHIRTVPLGEQPRRIAHMESAKALAVLTQQFNENAQTEAEYQTSFVRLFDDQTFEPFTSFQLDPTETGCALISCTFQEDPSDYFVVGTGYIVPEEPDPTRGRLLVFACMERRLRLVAEREVKGCVYSLAPFHGKLLATVNQKVQLLAWAPASLAPALGEGGPSSSVAEAEGVPAGWQRELQTVCTHHGHILALYCATRGDAIVVGDLMKSISLLTYKPGENSLEERARDPRPNWMAAVEILDEDTFVGAENFFNLFTVGRQQEGMGEDERTRLATIGEFHTGEFINRLRHGSLVMRLPEMELSQVPTMVFGTVNGAIGVLASLSKEHFLFLHRLEKCLNKVIKGVGGFSHREWRSFCSERRTVGDTKEALNFIDGDLVEAFLDLKKSRMEEVATLMDMTVEELTKRVEEFTRLH